MVTFSSHLMKLRFELRFWLEELRLSFQRNCWYNFKISYLFIHFSCLNYEPWKWIYILYGDNRSIKNSLQQWIFRRSYSFYTTKHILLTPLLREISKVNLSIEVLEWHYYRFWEHFTSHLYKQFQNKNERKILDLDIL